MSRTGPRSPRRSMTFLSRGGGGPIPPFTANVPRYWNPLGGGRSAPGTEALRGGARDGHQLGATVHQLMSKPGSTDTSSPDATSITCVSSSRGSEASAASYALVTMCGATSAAT